MKKNKNSIFFIVAILVLIVLVIFLVIKSIGINDKKGIKVEKSIIKNNFRIDNNIKNENIVVKKIINYKEISNIEDYKKKFEIKNGLIVDKNTLDNIVSMCNFLEGKTNFLYENGEKVYVDNKDLISLLTEHMKEDRSIEEYNDFEKLLNGKITGKYQFITDISKLDKSKFKNDLELLTYLGNYMLIMKNKINFTKYKKIYLEILQKIKDNNINENYIFSLELAYFYKNNKCGNFLKNNFINY